MVIFRRSISAFLIVLWAVGVAGAENPRVAGMALVDALRLMQSRGLKIIFSSALVTDDLIVDREPGAVDPMAAVEEILAPHGLAALRGPNDLLVVVASSNDSAEVAVGGSIVGRVNVGDDPSLFEGLTVMLGKTEVEVLADGAFGATGVPAGTYELRASSPLFDMSSLTTVTLRSGVVTPVVITFGPLSVFLNEIVITPSHFRILDDRPENRLSLDHDQVTQMPHVADDLFRAVKRLPGTAGGDVSAKFNIRGGAADEVLVMLDGVELFEPFHFKDFQSIFSIIDAETVGGVDFLTGGFPVEYGDRMSGVLDIRTATPTGPASTAISVSTINTRVVSEGTFHEGLGQWLVNGRAWYPARVVDAVASTSRDVKTDYYDVFAKAQHQVGENSILSMNGLFAFDDLGYGEEDFESRESVQARYKSYQLWLNLRTDWTDDVSSKTVLSVGRIYRRRQGDLWDAEDGSFYVSDIRKVDFIDFKQDWSYTRSDRHYVKWGVEAKRQRADYLYDSLQIPGNPGDGEESILRSDRFDPGGTSYAAYVADRFRLSEPLVVELGLRWDKQFYIGDHQLSPRINLVYDLGRRTVFRTAWGRFHQSQRLNELQIEDGVTWFYPAQLAEHLTVSLEHGLENGISARIEMYDKDLSNLRPRYENIFDPFDLFPEAAFDRVRVDPDRASVRGLELLLRSDGNSPLDWWASYGYARAHDRIEGKDVPRSWDQRHSATLGLNWRLPHGWNFNLAGSFHSGWPTTPATAVPVVDAEGGVEYELVYGPRNVDRLPNYLRFDLRTTRTFQLVKGEFTVFLEVINLTNRTNVCCFDDFDVVESPDGKVDVEYKATNWAPILPSVGVGWRF